MFKFDQIVNLGDYEYRYRQIFDGLLGKWITVDADIWGARVIDLSKQEYGKIKSYIYEYPVELSGTFCGCHEMVVSPMLPRATSSIRFTFKDCYKLQEAPNLTDSIVFMTGAFYGACSMRKFPEIPSSVVDMSWCFCGCKNISGDIWIPNSVQVADICFSGVESKIRVLYNSKLSKLRGYPLNWENKDLELLDIGSIV